MYTKCYINVYYRAADPNDIPVSYFSFSLLKANCQNKLCNNKFALFLVFLHFMNLRLAHWFIIRSTNKLKYVIVYFS